MRNMWSVVDKPRAQAIVSYFAPFHKFYRALYSTLFESFITNNVMTEQIESDNF